MSTALDEVDGLIDFLRLGYSPHGDTAALMGTAAETIERIREELETSQYKLWLVVSANGGVASIYEAYMARNARSECEMECAYDPAEQKYTIVARRAPTSDPQS